MNRVPPHDSDAEKAVVGGLLINNQAANDVLSILQANGCDFYHLGHAAVFQAALSLIDQSGVADLITTCASLRTQGILDKIGGYAFVSDIVDNAISAANIRHYCEIVKNKAIQRKIIAEASHLIEAAHSAGNTNEVLDEAQRTLFALSQERGKSTTLHSARELAKDTFSVIERRHDRGGKALTGQSTGIRDLDAITLGLHAGDLFIIAARPGVGKTALGLSIARHVAVVDNAPVLFCSLEMPADTLMTRLFASSTGIDSRQLQRGLVSNDRWTHLVRAASQIGEAPLFIDDLSSMTPMEIRSKARCIKSAHGLGLVIIDYLQLMHMPGKHDSREQAVAEISRSLKGLAKELNVPVIALSQLNRKVEDRPNRRPQMGDLRESGAIEQDADVIAFIYRDEVYNKSEDNPEKGIVEIDIAKHRNGPTGTVRAHFDAKTQTFSDIKNEGKNNNVNVIR